MQTPRIDPRTVDEKLGFIPDPGKRMNRRETAASRKYRQAFMARHNKYYCAGCRYNNSDHCAMRAQQFAWRGTGDCYAPLVAESIRLPSWMPLPLI